MVDLHLAFAKEDAAETCALRHMQKLLALVFILLFFDVALILMIIIDLFARIDFHILLVDLCQQMLYFIIIDLAQLLLFDAVVDFEMHLGKLLILCRFLVEI